MAKVTTAERRRWMATMPWLTPIEGKPKSRPMCKGKTRGGRKPCKLRAAWKYEALTRKALTEKYGRTYAAWAMLAPPGPYCFSHVWSIMLGYQDEADRYIAWVKETEGEDAVRTSPRIWTVGDPEPEDHPNVVAGGSGLLQDGSGEIAFPGPYHWRWEPPCDENGHTGGWWTYEHAGSLWSWESVLEQEGVVTEDLSDFWIKEKEGSGS